MKNYKKYLSKLTPDELKDEYMIGSDTISTLEKAKEDYLSYISIADSLLEIYKKRISLIENEYNKKLKN